MSHKATEIGTQTQDTKWKTLGRNNVKNYNLNLM